MSATNYSSLRARSAWRPLRDTEKEEVQKKRTAVQEEAQQILNVCTLLDEEVQLKQKSEPQTLPPAPPPLAGIAPVTSAPITTSPSRFPGLRALEDDVALARLLAQAAEEPETGEMPVSQKREMCAQFLEVGRCILDQTCPFAHCPSELFGHASSRSPKKRQPAYVQLLPDEHMAQQQAASARAYDRSTAAADDATLRRLLLANDSPSTARRW